MASMAAVKSAPASRLITHEDENAAGSTSLARGIMMRRGDP